jgi:hypothetical protein
MMGRMSVCLFKVIEITGYTFRIYLNSPLLFGCSLLHSGERSIRINFIGVCHRQLLLAEDAVSCGSSKGVPSPMFPIQPGAFSGLRP